MNSCLACNGEVTRPSYKYCSNKCQKRYIYLEHIHKWKIGLVSGSRGKVTKNISGHLKRYLTEKFGESCSICGWDKVHPLTGKVPIEIDHINGNAEDNREVNLRLICPNCHSLSMSFRNLNKGKGRNWRRLKYTKVNSNSLIK